MSGYIDGLCINLQNMNTGHLLTKPLLSLSLIYNAMYRYSKDLVSYCYDNNIIFIYFHCLRVCQNMHNVRSPFFARIDYLIFIYDPVLTMEVQGSFCILGHRGGGRHQYFEKYHVPSPLCFVENKK